MPIQPFNPPRVGGTGVSDLTQLMQMRQMQNNQPSFIEKAFGLIQSDAFMQMLQSFKDEDEPATAEVGASLGGNFGPIYGAMQNIARAFGGHSGS